MGTNAGNSVYFLFCYIIPFFFFLAGCTETYNKEMPLVDYILLKVKRILIPTFLFVLVIILINLIQNENCAAAFHLLKQAVIYGEIRNTPYVGTLWFFTCLFVMQIFFRLLRFLRNKWVILAISTALMLVAEFVLNHRPRIEPLWAWNVDSAMFYIFYYALGFSFYPYLKTWFELNNRVKKVSWSIVFGLSLIYSIALFGQKDLFEDFAMNQVFRWFEMILIFPLFIIMFMLCLSKLFENVEAFNNYGQNTLYLCGNEPILKMLVPCMTGLLGLEIQFPSPATAYFYCLILLVLAYKFVIPMEKAVLEWITNRFTKIIG